MVLDVFCESEDMVPKTGTARSIGYDIVAPYDFDLGKDDSLMLDTGVIISDFGAYKDWGYFIIPRGSSVKTTLELLNTIGVVEPDYSGPNDTIKLALHCRDISLNGMVGSLVNDDGRLYVKKGEKIAQIVFLPVLRPTLVWSGNKHPGGEDRGGFGSTGK